MNKEQQALPRREPRHKALVALRVTNEKLLERRLDRARAERMEGVTVLNPGAAMLGRMRARRITKLRDSKRAQPKGK